MTSAHNRPISECRIVVSPAMLQVIDLVQRVETAQRHGADHRREWGRQGTGRRAVHHHSLRCHKAWVDVSCAALPEPGGKRVFQGTRRALSAARTAPNPDCSSWPTTAPSSGRSRRTRVAHARSNSYVFWTAHHTIGWAACARWHVRIVAATNQNLEEIVLAGRFRSNTG